MNKSSVTRAVSRIMFVLSHLVAAGHEGEHQSHRDETEHHHRGNPGYEVHRSSPVRFRNRPQGRDVKATTVPPAAAGHNSAGDNT